SPPHFSKYRRPDVKSAPPILTSLKGLIKQVFKAFQLTLVPDDSTTCHCINGLNSIQPEEGDKGHLRFIDFKHYATLKITSANDHEGDYPSQISEKDNNMDLQCFSTMMSTTSNQLKVVFSVDHLLLGPLVEIGRGGSSSVMTLL